MYRAGRYKFVCHKFVLTDITLAIPVVRCHASVRRRHQRKPRPPSANLRTLACMDSYASTNRIASFMLQNVRSIIFLCLTETWQSQQDIFRLNQATTPGYAYIRKPCCLDYGGKLAVIHHSDIKVKEYPVSVSSFECLHLALTGASQL